MALSYPATGLGAYVDFDGVYGNVLNGMHTVHEAGFVNYKVALSDLS